MEALRVPGVSVARKPDRRAPRSASMQVAASALQEDVPPNLAGTFIVMSLGVVAMLIAQPMLIFAGWMLTFLSFLALLNRRGPLVSIGGSLMLSLLIMLVAFALAI